MKANKILNVLTIITSIILFLGLVILAVQVFSSGNEKKRFSENVVISGINVKGLNKEEAENKVSQKLKDKVENFKLKLVYKDKVWEYSSEDFVVSTNIHTIIDDAFKFSKINSSNKESVNKITKQGFNFDIAFNHIFLNFKEKVEEIKNEINFEAVNSEVEFNPALKELFKITKSKNGLILDEDKLYSEIEREFKNNNYIEIELKTIQVSPEKTEDFYKGKLELLGEFSTDLSTSKGGRKHNVSLALSKFNGKVIESGELVSFNEVTGPQTVEGGYKSAIVIVNGEFVEGIGGGICQASTTLYNALILSGSQIDEVHKHTLPVGYVELSLDAMVNEGTADLRFKNISEYPIYIQSYVEGDRAYARVYGAPLEEGITYKRSVEFVRTIPHSGDKIIKDEKGDYSDKVTYVGEYFRLSYPKEGYEAKGFIEKYKNNELISKEMIRHEIYAPKNGVLIEGTKTPEENTRTENNVNVIPPQIEVETISEINYNVVEF